MYPNFAAFARGRGGGVHGTFGWDLGHGSGRGDVRGSGRSGPPPLPRRPPPGVFGKLAGEKQLPARFTRKYRLFRTVNRKVVQRRCLRAERASPAAEEPFFARLRIQDSEMRGNNLQNGCWCKSLKTRRLQDYFGEGACRAWGEARLGSFWLLAISFWLLARSAVRANR